MNAVTVHKLNGQGESVVQYEARVLDRFVGGVRLEARWTRPALDLGYTRFDPGDRFVEWFFSDRWYNIFEIRAAESDALKGWYGNIAEPADIEHETISARDLLLDLWVTPDGATEVLDEDEFAADTTLDATTRARAESALQELITLVRKRCPPFDAILPSDAAGAS